MDDGIFIRGKNVTLTNAIIETDGSIEVVCKGGSNIRFRNVDFKSPNVTINGKPWYEVLDVIDAEIDNDNDTELN